MAKRSTKKAAVDPGPNAVEQAMVAAIEKCHADGITDPDKISKAMKEAREAIREG